MNSNLFAKIEERRKKLLLGAAIVIGLTIIFAPMSIFGESGVTGSCGYRFLTTPGNCEPNRFELARIDFPVLITYWIGIVLITYLLQLIRVEKIDTSLAEANITTLESELRRLVAALDNGDIGVDEYGNESITATIKLVDNLTLLRISQMEKGVLPEQEIIRRVHISPGQIADN